jgi:phosphoglycerate dehydrogenase-like enzyme
MPCHTKRGKKGKKKPLSKSPPAIDVTVEEPIGADNPLIKIPNVILTGHSAFYSMSSDRELFYKPVTQAVMALKGEWPMYGLNPEIREAWLQKWGRKA